ncbi:MAG: hypothetical protein OXF74_01600 [Rhodobacteraceae bacterium]|nr:hypothetical protein [Paracoccaceae bacterium]
MKRNIVQIYALAICMFCAAAMAVTLGFMGYGVIRIAAPSFTLSSYIHDSHADPEEFRSYRMNAAHESVQAKYAAMSDAELDVERHKSLDIKIAGERRGGYQGLLRSGIMLFVFAGFYLLHWKLSQRIAARERE